MGFVNDTFLGGAEKKAAKAQKKAARAGQGFIREGTAGAQDELNLGYDNAESQLSDFFGQAIGGQESALQNMIASLTGGTNDAIGTLQDSQGQGIDALMQALSGSSDLLNPFIEGGGKAFDLQQAFSGALGNEAQQKAYDDYAASPGQQHLRDQGELSINRGAASSGGLGGGALQTDLQTFGTGLAAQDFNNQYNRLGQLAGRGQDASSRLSANTMGTGSNIANLIAQMGGGIAGMQQGLGRSIADSQGNIQNIISQLLSSQGQGLSGLANERGANLAQLLLGQGTNLSNLEQGFGAADASGIMGAKNALGGLIKDGASFAAGGGFDGLGDGISDFFSDFGGDTLSRSSPGGGGF